MIEQWREIAREVYRHGVDYIHDNFTRLSDVAPEYVLVADTGTAVVRVRHQLRRVPLGVVVVNSSVASAAGPVGWYRDSDDDPWTDSEINLRFDVSNASVRLRLE